MVGGARPRLRKERARAFLTLARERERQEPRNAVGDRFPAAPTALFLGRVLKKLFLARPLFLTLGRVGNGGTLLSQENR